MGEGFEVALSQANVVTMWKQSAKHIHDREVVEEGRERASSGDDFKERPKDAR